MALIECFYPIYSYIISLICVIIESIHITRHEKRDKLKFADRSLSPSEYVFVGFYV